jgi:hypothetical protein
MGSEHGMMMARVAAISPTPLGLVRLKLEVQMMIRCACKIQDTRYNLIGNLSDSYHWQNLAQRNIDILTLIISTHVDGR